MRNSLHNKAGDPQRWLPAIERVLHNRSKSEVCAKYGLSERELDRLVDSWNAIPPFEGELEEVVIPFEAMAQDVFRFLVTKYGFTEESFHPGHSIVYTKQGIRITFGRSYNQVQSEVRLHTKSLGVNSRWAVLTFQLSKLAACCGESFEEIPVDYMRVHGANDDWRTTIEFQLRRFAAELSKRANYVLSPDPVVIEYVLPCLEPTVNWARNTNVQQT